MEPGKDETTTKENYKNGDIHWNMYTGVFKAYDKDGNEVKFPTDDLSYEVKFEDVEKGKTMTEEIIIDGINVAGCAHLVTVKGGEPPFCRLDDFTCEGETCYYKQLKRLAQENEQLKVLKDKYYTEKLDMEAQLSYCIQALEEIKEIAGDAIDIIIENDELLNYVGCIYNKINEVLKED